MKGLGVAGISLVVLILLSVLFYLFPVDLSVSGYFYHHLFFHRLGLQAVMGWVRLSYKLLVVAWILWLLLMIVKKNRDGSYRAIFVGLCLLMVAVVPPTIKVLIGRSRPVYMRVFGGSQPYTYPWQVAHTCSHNCSFISGEGAFAFQVLSLALVLRRRRNRRWAALLGLGYFLLVAGLRVMLGRHFLSDVLLAACVMAVFDGVLYHAMFDGDDSPRWRAFASRSLRRVPMDHKDSLEEEVTQ